MPRIFDNIEQPLLDALLETLRLARRADFCVGYFNLRGWKQLDHAIDDWTGGEDSRCRLLVGMQRLPADELRAALSPAHRDDDIDNQTALRLKKRLAEEFREQLALGTPSNADEACLRRLAKQIRAGTVVVKLFLRHPLHAKLYLLFRPDPISPIVGYLGSSNLTLAGLAGQGELNVDVLDHDACAKLARWFDDRWDDRWCIDISAELAQIIEESWARESLIPPYHIYIKMAYHLSQEARAGLTEFRIPADFRRKLFEFQSAAVRIAAHHLNKRGGVLIGDVVGLGKTLMATALARIFEDDFGLETLILCPRNLVKMWEDYREQYRLRTNLFKRLESSGFAFLPSNERSRGRIHPIRKIGTTVPDVGEGARLGTSTPTLVGLQAPAHLDRITGRTFSRRDQGYCECRMSKLTVELVAQAKPRPHSSRWREAFGAIADRLVATYGVPALGNFHDPIGEIFYIVLSARTTDAQYRRTHRALQSKFPRLEELAKASTKAVVSCILGGGLANKRASQVKRIAARLLSELGERPAKRLKEMPPSDAYAFLTGLPGMGPKSALCVMMYSLGHDAFPVDANVQRVASRLGAIPSGLKHYRAQQRLPGLVPDGRSKELHIGLVAHGRAVCLPRNPRCESCVIWDLCRLGKKRLAARGGE